MNEHGFDRLTRTLAIGRSRRGILRDLAGGAVGGTLALFASRPDGAGAVVGGYVEIHNVACPLGYDPDDVFNECHDNRLPGVAFVADGPGGRHYEDETDAEGRVVFGDFLEAGKVTISQARMSGDFADYYVYCSRVDTTEQIPVEKRANGRAAAVFTLPQEVVDAGTGVVCDWYNLPAAEMPQFTSSIEIHESACPADAELGSLFETCHANGLPGVELSLQGPENRSGTTQGPIGLIRFDELPAGTYTVAETRPTGVFAEYVVYCSDQEDREVPFVYRGNGRAAFELTVAEGQQVICDWYNIPAEQTGPPVNGEAPQGGIGLGRSDWEQIHGAGQKNGAIVSYEDGTYAVAYSYGNVTFVETGWEDQGGIDPAEAVDVVLDLIPADARLVQRYYLPATPGGPIGLAVERYESDWLSDRMSGASLDWDGSIVVIYQQRSVSQGAANGEPTITRVSLAAGTAV